MNPVSTIVATEGEILNFSSPKSPENAFSGIFTYLKLVKKYYNFVIFQYILCKTYDEGILCIANSSYAVETPKDEVTCGKYWNFYKKLKMRTCFPQNGRFRDQTGGRETISQNGRVGRNIFINQMRKT